MGVISTSQYWTYRGTKIPPAYPLLGDETEWRERETAFYTDVEAIASTAIGQASRQSTGQYGPAYFHNRRLALRRDRCTCTVCGYKSQRQKGDVHDLEVHHVDPNGDVQFVSHVIADSRLSSRLTECKFENHLA